MHYTSLVAGLAALIASVLAPFAVAVPSAQAASAAADTTAPTAPTGLGGFPATETVSDRFTIFWTNPTDESGIAAARYTLDNAPTSNLDGTRVAPVTDPSNATLGLIENIATGGRSARTLYLWLEDGVGNLDVTATATVVLRPEGSLDSIVRVAGDDRFATAAATSRKAFPVDATASNVVLANGRGFADALAGVPLAFRANAPILLTERNRIPQSTWDELIRVLTSGGTVYILGGTSAIDAQQESFLQGAGFTTKRLSGSDRVKTSVAILGELDTLKGAAPTRLYLVNGFSFPDALSVSPLAAFQQAGILLTEPGDLSQAGRDYLNAHASTIATVTLVGGTAVIPSSVATLLVGAGYHVPRFDGSDRYHTSRIIADTFLSDTPPSPPGVALASGEGFADALPAGVHAAAQLYPLLLLPSSQSKLHCAQSYDYLATNHAAITGAYLYGGTAAVNASVLSDAQAAIGGTRIACGQ